MTLDARTACPACPIVIRNLQASADVLVALLDRYPHTKWPVDVIEAVENLRIAAGHTRPLVEAHLENQEHAMSVHLAPARNTTTSTVTVQLDRGLPFGGSA
jgi:hypothetical protein